MITENLNKTGWVKEEWQPETPIKIPPLFAWPPRPLFLFKYFFSFPGYFFPWNFGFMILAFLTWIFLTPDISLMNKFELDWILLIYSRNICFLFLVFGGLHFYLYIKKSQGTQYKFNNRWQGINHRRFFLKNQTFDNVFWSTVSGCSIWTIYEVLILWGYANNYFPHLDWKKHPVIFVIILCLLPIIREIHFYLIHRLLHYRFMYKNFHYLHHKNVNIGPWSGLSMHPCEHILYFSGVMLHWIIISHPIHLIFHLQQLGLLPALGHCGFSKLVMKGQKSLPLGEMYFHYLHHRYFECNYGGVGPVPLDKWFGTFHDGTKESHAIMKTRRREALSVT